MIDERTRRQFIRDFKLPIQIVKSEYFEYFIELFEEQYKSKTKYKLLEDTVHSFGCLETFQQECLDVRKRAIEHVSKKEAYTELSQEKLTNFNSKFSYKTNLYNHDNTDKHFVSIDLVKGNFQALKFYNPELVDNTESYEEFLSQFTDLEYMKQSKQIRQVIFGQLLPKKQKKIQEHLMEQVKNKLMEFGLTEEMIKATSPDEIVFEIDDLNDYQKYESFIEEEISPDFEVHFEVFTLKSLFDDLSCFLKVFKNKDGFDIKKSNLKYMPELIKYLRKEPLSKMDLCFMDEGRIASYQEPLFYKEGIKNED